MNTARFTLQVSCGCGAVFKLGLGRYDSPGLVLAAAKEHAEHTGHGMDLRGIIHPERRARPVADRPKYEPREQHV